MFAERRGPAWQRSTLAFVGVVAAVFVEGSGYLRFGEAAVVPDLALCGVLAWAYLYGPGAGAALGFVAGLALGSISVGPVGLQALMLAALGLAVGAVRLGEYSQDIIWVVAAGLAGSSAYYAVSLLVARLQAGAIPLSAGLLHLLLPALVMDTLLVVFLVSVLRRQGRRQIGRYQV